MRIPHSARTACVYVEMCRRSTVGQVAIFLSYGTFVCICGITRATTQGVSELGEGPDQELSGFEGVRVRHLHSACFTPSRLVWWMHRSVREESPTLGTPQSQQLRKALSPGAPQGSRQLSRLAIFIIHLAHPWAPTQCGGSRTWFLTRPIRTAPEESAESRIPVQDFGDFPLSGETSWFDMKNQLVLSPYISRFLHSELGLLFSYSSQT